MSLAQTIANNAKNAAIVFRSSSSTDRNSALSCIASKLKEQTDIIIKENRKDLEEAKGKLNSAMINRLTLDESSILAMSNAVMEISQQEEVVGSVVEEKKRPNGLSIKQVRVPLGVLLMIFESRPNVVIDCSALAIKSGNAIILKGGKEASHTNNILAEIVRQAIREHIPQDVVQLLDSSDRECVQKLITMNDHLDLVIPRGGESLIRSIYQNSTVPVVAHFRGLCHQYVHKDAELSKAVDICFNAKAQRPGVCNALESLLVHEEIAQTFCKDLFAKLQEAQVEIRGCLKLKEIFPEIILASDEDWDTEYLANIISVKMVEDQQEAIKHIQRYGTQHTEGICAKDKNVIDEFVSSIDASCIMINSSNRFNDGGELGLGAELGISTTKIHAYGPMGAREMTISRYIVEGDGHVRS